MNTGIIHLDSGIDISDTLTPYQLLNMTAGLQIDTLVDNAPYVSYRLTEQAYSGMPCVVILYFNGLSLESLSLYMLWEADPSAGLKEISDVGMQEWRHKQNVEFLKRNLGEPPYQYIWGTVTANRDTRAGFSSIIVRFSQTESLTRP